MHFGLLMTQLSRIAEKERMGLPYPCVVLVSTSAMPMARRRATWSRGVKCGIARVLLACFMRSWDRAILDRVNTWIDLESDPMSCSWMIPLPVSAGIACHRL